MPAETYDAWWGAPEALVGSCGSPWRLPRGRWDAVGGAVLTIGDSELRPGPPGAARIRHAGAMAIQITGDDAADAVLEQPFALLAGMMLDQQYPMEHAFRGPHKVAERFGSVEPGEIAAADPERFAELCATPPAIHRFPGSMAARLQELARVVEEEYGGRAERIWTEAADGRDLMRRLTALPGFGKQKARIFVSLVAKQCDVQPEGWQEVAGDYALEGYRSVADVVDPDSLQKVREYKKQQKAAAKAGS